MPESPGRQARLTAIAKVDSNHGRSHAAGVTSGENSAGADGPMQFLSATWAAYGGEANYPCHNGAGKPSRLRSAIFAYNHADRYVDKVLDQAQAYAGKDASSNCRSCWLASRTS